MLELRYRKLISKTATIALVTGLLSFISIPAANAADADITITETNIATAVTVTAGADAALTGVIYTSGTVTAAVANAGATIKALCVTGGTIASTGYVSAGSTYTSTSLITASAVGIAGAVITPTAAGTDMVITTRANTCGGAVFDQITYTVLSGGASDGIATISAGAVCSATNDAGTALSLPFISSAAGFNIVVPIGASLTMALDANDNAEFNGPISAATLNNDGLNNTLAMSINTKGRVLIDDPGNLDETFIVTATSLGSASIVVSADGASTTPSDVTTNSLDITVVASCASDVYSASKSTLRVKGTDATVAVVTTNVDSSTSAAAGESIFINVRARNTYASALTTGTLSASATNGALVSWGNDGIVAPSKGTVSVSTITPDGEDILRVNPASSLVSSTTVVTITHNGTAVGTKTLTFSGEAASIEVVSTSAGLLSTGVTADTATGFLLYQYKDTAGNVVPGASASLDATTQTTTVQTVVAEKAPTSSPAAVTGNLLTAIETALDTTTYGVMSFGCGTTSGASTVTIKHTNAISAASITKTVALTCAGGIDTYVVSTDKASYAIGEIATITITAKDSTGKPVHGVAAMGAADTVSVGGGTLTKAVAATDTFTAGVRTYKAQMTTAGTFNVVVSVAGSTTTSATTSYKVASDGSVSNAQVLQSIVALIASINKQIQALQALILKKK
jgi:hypothetical protein